MTRKALLSSVVGLAALALAASAHAAFTRGNVLAGVGQGMIKEFTPTGALVATYDTGTGSNETTGMCFDAAGNLYATMFTSGVVSKFSPTGTLINGSFVSGFAGSPESCQVNQAGELLVGTTGGQIKRFNATTGALLNTYTVSGGAGWIDIAADQCTVFYADDSSTVQRFNICTNTQLATFANMSSLASGLRILPGGDVLASDRTSVSRFNPSGTLIGNYGAPAGNSLIFAVTVDPDGQTFWTADLVNGNIFRYNLTPISNTPVTTFNSGQLVDTAGILVVGEITVGGPPSGPPVIQTNVPVPTLSQWGLAMLIALLGGLAVIEGRRRMR